MIFRKNTLRELILGRRASRSVTSRRPRKTILSCDTLEGRVTPAHIGIAHHAVAHLHAAAHHAATSTTSTSANTSTLTSSTTGTSSTGSTSTTTSSTLSTALQTLRTDIQTIELASGTTVGQLTAIRAAFQALSTDGLTPSSASALQSFENSLVTSFASGTTLTGNATLLAQFEALYTGSPTTQQTADLTTAYNALAAAVTSSNITSADITTINTDWSAVLAAEGSTSTSTYPYFSLVTGHEGAGGPGGCA
jgi:hypothetical protein